MPSLVVIRQQIKEKRRGGTMPYMVPKYPSLNRVKVVETFKNINIYNYGMSVFKKILKPSKNGCDEALLNCICEYYDQIECVLNKDEYKEPKKHNHNLCVDCKMETWK